MLRIHAAVGKVLVKMALQYVLLFLLGGIFSELSGYFWHKHVAHFGALKKITPYDFLRKRHVYHHEINYNPKKDKSLISTPYRNACEITFNYLAVLLIMIFTAIAYIGYISWAVYSSFIGGAVVYGLLILAPFHKFYHLSDPVLRRKLIFRNKYSWKAFKWLQAYHEIHHYKNKNFSIFVPVDIILGTYMPPIELMKQKKMKKENLFPGFTNSMSTCGKPLFVK